MRARAQDGPQRVVGNHRTTFRRRIVAAARRRRVAERGELVRIEWGQEVVQPFDEDLPLRHHRHQRRFFQARRNEVGTSRFVRGRTPRVSTEEADSGVPQHRLQFGPVTHRLRLEARRDRERRVGMHARSHRSLEFLQVGDQPRAHQFRDRFEARGPGRRIGILPRRQLTLQEQQPRPSVGALEGGIVGEVSEFPRHGVFGEVIPELFADQRRHREARRLLDQTDHRPGGVHRRVPVPATVERALLLEAATPRVGYVVDVPGAVRAQRVGTVDAGERHRRQRQGRFEIEGAVGRRCRSCCFRCGVDALRIVYRLTTGVIGLVGRAAEGRDQDAKANGVPAPASSRADACCSAASGGVSCSCGSWAGHGRMSCGCVPQREGNPCIQSRYLPGKRYCRMRTAVTGWCWS